jgi:non-ribosomal peptide synthetase component F
VGADTLVGLLPERTMELVIGALGILKAGGAYVPLDRQYPHERLALMIADAGLSTMLTHQHLLDALPGTAARVVCLDRDWGTIAEESDENPMGGSSAENLAYVIYTSGSTGHPKGVAITHGSAGVMVQWAHEVFSRGELAGVLAATSLCFDLSVF